jgi:hypothetical protein
MIRTARSIALTGLLATAALAGIPATASADAADHTPGITINCWQCQIAAGSIYNAGRDNLVGNGGGEMPGVGLPDLYSLFRIVPRHSAYPGLDLVSQKGEAQYPRGLDADDEKLAFSAGPSSAVYESFRGLGHVEITVKYGDQQPTCTSDGNMFCYVDRDAPEMVKPIIIEGR